MSGSNSNGKRPTWQDQDNAIHSSFSSTGSSHVQFDQNVHGDGSRTNSHGHLAAPSQDVHQDSELRRRRSGLYSRCNDLHTNLAYYPDLQWLCASTRSCMQEELTA